MLGRRAFWIAATLVGLAFLAAAVSRLDLEAVLAGFRHARIWPWVPLGILGYLLGHRIRGRRLARLVSREATLTTGSATHVVVVGYAVNNLLPARLGELARAWMLVERSGLSVVQSLTVTLVERLLDAFVLLAFFGVATLMMPASTLQIVELRVALGLLGIATVALGVGVLAPGPVLGLVSRAANRWAPRAHDAITRRAFAALSGLAYLRRPRQALEILGLSVLVWSCEASLYLLMLPAFGLALKPVVAAFAMASTNLAILLPSTPGFIGPFHFFCMRALVTAGTPREVAFDYAVLLHAAFYVPITVWGGAVLASQGLSIGRALALSRVARALPAASSAVTAAPWRAEPEPKPSRFMIALAEAAIPLDADGISGESRTAVVAEVATFLAGQLEMLPTRLRFAFDAGFTAFRFATRVRFLRGFCELPGPRRSAWFEQWAYGNAALGRSLFRAVRSTALLAYYEQPAARAALDASSASMRPAHETI